MCAWFVPCLLACLPAWLQAGLTARGGQLESSAAELAQYKERLRKGRFHIITEQVQQAKVSSRHTIYGDVVPCLAGVGSAGGCRQIRQAAFLQFIESKCMLCVPDGWGLFCGLKP
jgi:hypothetical protein